MASGTPKPVALKISRCLLLLGLRCSWVAPLFYPLSSLPSSISIRFFQTYYGYRYRYHCSIFYACMEEKRQQAITSLWLAFARHRLHYFSLLVNAVLSLSFRTTVDRQAIPGQVFPIIRTAVRYVYCVFANPRLSRMRFIHSSKNRSIRDSSFADIPILSQNYPEENG